MSRQHEDVRRGDGCYPAATLEESEAGLMHLPAVHPMFSMKSDMKKTARNLCLKGVTCQALYICLFQLISNVFVIIFTFLFILSGHICDIIDYLFCSIIITFEYESL